MNRKTYNLPPIALEFCESKYVTSKRISRQYKTILEYFYEWERKYSFPDTRVKLERFIARTDQSGITDMFCHISVENHIRIYFRWLKYNKNKTISLKILFGNRAHWNHQLPTIATDYLQRFSGENKKEVTRVLWLFYFNQEKRKVKTEMISYYQINNFKEEVMSKWMKGKFYRGKLKNYLRWLYDQKIINTYYDDNLNKIRKPIKIDLEKEVCQYLQFVKTIHSKNTYALYRWTIKKLYNYLDEKSVQIGDIDRQFVEKWLIRLIEEKLSASSRITLILNLKGYFDWLVGKNIIKVNFITSNDIPKSPIYLPRPLEPKIDQQYQKILRERNNLFSLGLLLMRKTGLRLGELVDLEYNCVTADVKGNLSMKVPLGKMKNERTVPLESFTAELIGTIKKISKRNFSSKKEMPHSLFINKHGVKARNSYFTNELTLINKQLHQSNMSSHRFRHTFATEMLTSGMNIVILKKILGHKSISTTLQYANVTNSYIQEEYDKVVKKIENKNGILTDKVSEENLSPLEALEYLIRTLKEEKNDGINPIVKRLYRLKQDLCAIHGHK